MPDKPTYEELEEIILKLKSADLDRQKKEEQLEEEIQRWRIMLEQSRDGIVVLDQNGKVYEANIRFADMLGYSIEEVYELYVWDWDFIYTKEELIEMVGDVGEEGAHFETKHRRKDGSIIDVELSNNGALYRGQKLIFCLCRDITDRKKAEEEREKLIGELQSALAEIETLRGLLPICANCKNIRNEKGQWERIELYISKHSKAEFTHGLCPECVKKLYPDLYSKQ